jgi:hypothetical protein
MMEIKLKWEDIKKLMIHVGVIQTIIHVSMSILEANCVTIKKYLRRIPPSVVDTLLVVIMTYYPINAVKGQNYVTP